MHDPQALRGRGIQIRAQGGKSQEEYRQVRGECQHRQHQQCQPGPFLPGGA